MRSPEVPDIGQLTPEAPDVKRFVAEWFRLKLVDQVLYRLKPAAGGRPEYLQLVVPASMRQDFMRRAHTGMTGGHYGSQRTQDQLQQRGYWYGWRKDVKRFCRQCENCSERYFQGWLPRTAQLQPLVTGGLFRSGRLQLYIVRRVSSGRRKCNLGSQAPRYWIPRIRRRRRTSAKWRKDDGESEPTGEAETIDLGDAEEVGSASPGQVVQWWPPLTAHRSPRPRRNAPIPARYRD